MVDTSSEWRIHLADNDAGMNGQERMFTDLDEGKSTQGSFLKVASKVSFVYIDFPNDFKSSDDELRKLKTRKLSNPFEATFAGSDVEYFVKERSVDSDCGVPSMEPAVGFCKNWQSL